MRVFDLRVKQSDQKTRKLEMIQIKAATRIQKGAPPVFFRSTMNCLHLMTNHGKSPPTGDVAEWLKATVC